MKHFTFLKEFYATFEESEGILSEILLDVVTEMPLVNLERLSNPKTFENVSKKSLKNGQK
jgi:hypothetical protein